MAWVQKLLPISDQARAEMRFASDRARRPAPEIRRSAVAALLFALSSITLPITLPITLLIAGPAIADTTPRIELEGMSFVASRENNDAVILRAEHARFDTEAKLAHLRGVDAEIPAAPGKRGFQMRCDTGVVDLSSNDFEMKGNVSGETDSGEHFEAEWVRYDHEKGVLYTDVPVLMTHRGTTFRGGGFSYDIATRRFQLLGGARVVQTAEDLKKAVGR